MEANKTALERAFELAKSGKFSNTTDIKSALRGEGYPTDTVTGGALLKQLRELIAQAISSA